MSKRDEDILNANEDHHQILRSKITEILAVTHQWMQDQVPAEVFEMTLKGLLDTAFVSVTQIGGSVVQLYHRFYEELKILVEGGRDLNQFKVVMNAVQNLSDALEVY